MSSSGNSVLRTAATAVLVALVAAQFAEAFVVPHMVVEETCERHQVLAPPCAQQVQQPVVVGIPYTQVVQAAVPVVQQQQQCFVQHQHVPQCHVQHQVQHHHVQQRCACGGSKHDGTCTCGQKQPACGCETKKKSCGCGDKVSCLAEEGISTLFKVVRGGMKMVEHLADSIKKKEVCCPKKKPCGCCGCGARCGGGCGGGVGCHAALPVLPVVVGGGCGCRL